MTALAGNAGSVLITSGANITFTSEAMTDAGDHINYQITNLVKQYWDDSVAPTIEASTDSGSTWHAAPANTVQYVNGRVKFASANGSGDLIRASGKYFATATLATANEWDLSLDVNMVDTTVFSDSFKEQVPIMISATAKVSQFYVDNTFIALMASRMILVLYVNATHHYDAYAYLKADSIKDAAAGVITEDLEFDIAGVLYYN